MDKNLMTKIFNLEDLQICNRENIEDFQDIKVQIVDEKVFQICDHGNDGF